MPRQIRIEYPVALYHSWHGGGRREGIFADERDCDKLAGRLLMENNYHRLIETPQGNLIEEMRGVQNTQIPRLNAQAAEACFWRG
jgi:hypothetical protein